MNVPDLNGAVTSRDERITKAVSEASPLYRTILQKAYAGIAPPRSAIKAQCLICVGYQRLMVTATV